MAVALSLAGTLVLTGAVIPLLRGVGLLDRANSRSSHQGTVPRGGGLPVVAVLATGCLVVAPTASTLVVVTVVVALAVVGLVDDRRGLPVRIRLVAQVGAGMALALGLNATTEVAPHRVLFVALVPLGLAAYVNAFNFMDGINAVSALSAAVSGAWFTWVGLTERLDLLAVLGALTAACAVGFLPWNLGGRIFLGDVGSYGLGAAVASCAALAWAGGAPAVVCVAPLVVYLVDTGWVIVKLVARGGALGVPHRDHVYQRLVHQRGWTHLQSSLWVAAASAAVCLVVEAGRGRVPFPLLVLAVVALVLAYVAPAGAAGHDLSIGRRR